MTRETFSRLKQAAKRIEESTTQSDKMNSLAQAFDLFSEETEKLNNYYSTLCTDFATTRESLATQNDQLNKKVAQLDAITRYLHNILNHISHGILFIDLNGIITTYNGPAETILESDSLDVLFSSYWDHFSDDLFGFSMGEALATRNAPDTLFTNIETKSGEVRELELHTSFVLQEENRSGEKVKHEEDYIEVIQGIVIVMRDRTEINKLRRLANRNDRMKELGEIAASVAHEIRNPLGGIKGFASLLHRDLSDTPHLQQMTSHIIDGADNLNRLVTNVLNYARPVQLQREPTDLVVMAKDLKRYISAEYSNPPAIEVHLETELESLKIPIDRQLIHGALLNLIVNAVQAMPEGGAIHLGIKEEVGQAIITVADTGQGISDEHIDYIFSPFFTTKATGNGFGLSEVHKVILAHEGIIEVKSEIGAGTTFTLKLPSKSYVRKKI